MNKLNSQTISDSSEKAFLRLIIWDGANWKSLFIDNLEM